MQISCFVDFNIELISYFRTHFKECIAYIDNMSHVMRKPVYAICDQHSLSSTFVVRCLDSIIIRNFKPLASFCGSAGWFESYLVINPEDRFSHDEAHINIKVMPVL